MKKLAIILTSILALCASLNAQSTPELLKNRAEFSNYKKFEDPAIYSNMQENANIIAAYEANPSSYKAEELFPVIMSYMSVRNIEKGEELLLKHVAVVPNNAAALRNLASVNMIKGNNEAGIEYYKKATATGDVLGLKSLASAYLITKQTDKISEIVAPLKDLAKIDLEAANILLIYSLSDNVKDKSLADEVVANLNLDEVLKAPSIDALNSSFNIYANNKELWKGETALIPARVAVLRNAWVLASEAVDTALAAKPNSFLALKTKAIVEYRTGDVSAAFKNIEKAIKLGDATAYNDLVALALDSNRAAKIQENMNILKKQDLNVNTNLSLIRYGFARNDADLFFLGAMGKENDILFSTEQTKLLISEGLKKFSSDSRAKEIQAKLK